MRIAADGTWFYCGSPIGRAPLVQLFASILRKDGDRYVLVTPVEKVGIKVDDAPFLAVEMARGEGDEPRLTFRTNVEDIVTVDAEHPLRFERGAAEGLKPYVNVRGDLWALVKRALFYDLVALGKRSGQRRGLVRRALAWTLLSHVPRERNRGALSAVPVFVLEPRRRCAGWREKAARLARRHGSRRPTAAPRSDDSPRRRGCRAEALAAPAPPPFFCRSSTGRRLSVLLTLRASDLRAHSGQIAFPGGKIDPGEAPREAALREAQ